MCKYNNRKTESNFTFSGTTFSVLTAISLWAKRFLSGTLSWRTSSITYAYRLLCLRNWMQLHVFVLCSKCIVNTNQIMEIDNTSLTCEPKIRTPKIISNLMAFFTKYLSWSSWFWTKLIKTNYWYIIGTSVLEKKLAMFKKWKK